MGRAEAIWVVIPKAHASEVQQPRAEPQTPSSNHIQPEKGSSQSVVVLQTQSLLWRLLPWRSLCRMAKSYPYKNNSTPVTPTACGVCGRSPTPQPPLHSGKSSQAAEHFEQGIVWMGTNISFSLRIKGRGTLEQTQTWGSNVTNAFGHRRDCLYGRLLLTALLQDLLTRHLTQDCVEIRFWCMAWESWCLFKHHC